MSSVAIIVSVLVGFEFFASLNADMYYRRFFLLEIGIVGEFVTLGLLALTARANAGEWARLVFLPLILILGAMCLWAVLFERYTGSPASYSFLALRYWLYYLLAPIVFLAYRSGVRWQYLARSVTIGLYAAVAVIAIAYTVLPLELYAMSKDVEVRRLVRTDALRGVRLDVPHVAITMALGLSFMQVLRSRGRSFLAIALFSLCAYVVFRSYSRVLLASFGAAGFLYLLYARTHGTFVLRAAVILIFSASIGGLLIGHLGALDEYIGRDLSFLSRANALDIAFREIAQRPFFGIGKDSYNSLTFQRLYGVYFVPTDLGFVGTVFRFGLVGLLIYLSIGAACIAAARNTIVSKTALARSPLSISLAIIALTLAISSISFVGFIDKDGIPISGLIIGFYMISRDLTARAARTERTGGG